MEGWVSGGSLQRVTLPFTAVFDNIYGQFVTTGIACRGQNAIKYHILHSIDLTTKNYLHQNVNTAEFEKPWGRERVNVQRI
jgi:hypothetical protein